MSSEVDICNLALSFIGDTASVSSIDPPEGSAQSEHCARFYPIARDAILEDHAWGFTTTRAALALLSLTMDQWLYVYQVPSEATGIISVIPADAPDDYTYVNGSSDYPYLQTFAAYSPQPFQQETYSGYDVILTNCEDAHARYTKRVTDPTKFPTLVVITIAHYLAALLAGPIIKGDAGKAESKAQMQLMAAALSRATAADSGDRNVKPAHVVPWMNGR